MINKCWSKFPDPPTPSEVHETDNDLRQRDLLSIECGQKLNEALLLHHKTRNCPEPGSESESTESISFGSRKVGKLETKQANKGSDEDTTTSEGGDSAG